MANSNIYLETVFIQERRTHLGKLNSILLKIVISCSLFVANVYILQK